MVEYSRSCLDNDSLETTDNGPLGILENASVGTSKGSFTSRILDNRFINDFFANSHSTNWYGVPSMVTDKWVNCVPIYHCTVLPSIFTYLISFASLRSGSQVSLRSFRSWKTQAQPSGLLNLGHAAILDRVILCSPVHWRTFSSFLGLNPRNASSAPIYSCDKQKCHHAWPNVLWGSKSPPIENHWVKWFDQVQR